MKTFHMILAILLGIAGATLIIAVNEITDSYMILVLYTCITWCSMAIMEMFTQ